jgi:hypothetical protein
MWLDMGTELLRLRQTKTEWMTIHSLNTKVPCHEEQMWSLVLIFADWLKVTTRAAIRTNPIDGIMIGQWRLLSRVCK